MIRATFFCSTSSDTLGMSNTFQQAVPPPNNPGNPGNPHVDQIISGPPGTGSGNGVQKWFGNQMFEMNLDPQGTWNLGFNIQPFYQIAGSVVWPLDKFLQFTAGGVAIIALEIQTDGKIGIRDGGDGTSGTGTLLGVTSQVFALFAWSQYLEISISGTTVELWLDDAKILSVTSSALSTHTIDSFLIGSQNGRSDGSDQVQYFGMGYSNGYISDGQGPAPQNGRLGPVRMTTIPMSGDGTTSWAITPPTLTGCFRAITDSFPGDGNGSPDFDHSYISPVTSINNYQWFTVAAAPCYGRILGVSMHLCFRGSTGSTTCDGNILQASTITQIGTATVTAPSGIYQTQQLIQQLNPASGTYWSDGEIAQAFWGVSTGSPGLLLTQVFLVKVVSLRNLPFNCGQSGGYSY